MRTRPAPQIWTEVFDEVAERVRVKIRDDRALFPRDEELTGLLDYLADHLFDFDLDVNTWLRACDGSREAHDRFVAKLGSLKAYLDEKRITVAAEALGRTSAAIGKIARRAGFEVSRTFQRTFERVLGMPPSAVTRPPPDGEEATSGTAPEAGDPVYGTRLLATYWRRQVTLGLLDVERATELRHLLRELYEALRNVPWCRDLRPGRRIPLRQLLTGHVEDDAAIAFAPTEAAIGHDSQLAQWSLRGLFGQVYSHLFRPKLRLDHIVEAAQLPPSAWRHFKALVGQSPWSYIRDARMEIAARMLLLSSLRVGKICAWLGYARPSTFHRSFQEFTGLGPTDYRCQTRYRLELAGPTPWDYADPEYWPKAVSGQLMLVEAVKLDEYVERLFPAEAWHTQAVSGGGEPVD